MKNKKHINVDFFLTNESFIFWAKGDESLSSYWEKWLQEHPDAEKEFNDALCVASEIHIKEEPISSEWIKKIKLGIDSKIDSRSNSRKLISTRYKPSGYDKRKNFYYAASLILVIGVSFYLGYFAKNEQPPQDLSYMIKETNKGQKLSFYLSDGTKVKLNSLSSLKYQDFSDTSRIVFLEGEAFFDVVKDSLRPFTVITEHLQTRVLGTSFNVKAIAEEDQNVVALLSGKVMLRDKNNNALELSPGQVAKGKKNAGVTLVDDDIKKHVAWKYGIIQFHQADLQQVFQELSLWYGVQFIIEGGDQQDRPWQYTGTFDNKSLNLILMSLSYVKNFDYTIKKDKVYIKL